MVASACGLAVSAWSILPSFINLPLFLVLAAIFTLPGWALARWFAGDESDRMTRVILALPLGYCAGATACAALRVVGISAPAAVLLACASLGGVLAWVFRRPQPGLVPLVRLGGHDHLALGILWLLALAVVGPIFARLGEVTPAGLAYRAYFNADLFVHMSVVAEFAKGSAPLANPFFPGEPLPYYWTYFVLPGVFAQLRPSLPVDPAIALTDTGMALVFISVGFLVVRNLGATARATAVSWAVILLASSFEGAYWLWDQISYGRPLGELRVWNIDAVTRWVWNLPGVDGFHRAMWWTPQHLMALTLGMLVLLTMVRGRRPNGIGQAAFEGLLLGSIITISSFNGLLIVASYGLAQVVILALDRGRDFGPWFMARAVAAIIVACFTGLTIGLGMVQSTPNAFLIGWNRYFLRGPWTFILLSFGPALFLAPLGLRAAWAASRRMVVTLAAITSVIAVAFLFVDIRGHENTQITFRTGHLVYICLAILLAFAIDAWRSWPRWTAAGCSLLLLIGAAAALPTVAIDWYNARDISNVEMGPGNFPWTVHISPDDDAAAQWMAAILPPGATVQTDALPRERYTWAYIPAFAQRRMAVGNGLFMMNPARYRDALDRVHDAYSTASAEAAHASFVELGVDYVFVGELERRVNGEQVVKFGLNPRLFEAVYWQGSVAIFKVLK